MIDLQRAPQSVDSTCVYGSVYSQDLLIAVAFIAAFMVLLTLNTLTTDLDYQQRVYTLLNKAKVIRERHAKNVASLSAAEVGVMPVSESVLPPPSRKAA